MKRGRPRGGLFSLRLERFRMIGLSVHGIDRRGVLSLHFPTLEFQAWREFAASDGEFVRNKQHALQSLKTGEARVEFRDDVVEQRLNFGMMDELLARGEAD